MTNLEKLLACGAPHELSCSINIKTGLLRAVVWLPENGGESWRSYEICAEQELSEQVLTEILKILRNPTESIELFKAIGWLPVASAKKSLLTASGKKLATITEDDL